MKVYIDTDWNLVDVSLGHNPEIPQGPCNTCFGADPTPSSPTRRPEEPYETWPSDECVECDG
jgi:hypothetical protein